MSSQSRHDPARFAVSRRTFMVSALAAGTAAAALPWRPHGALAQGAPHRIDVHHHLSPPTAHRGPAQGQARLAADVQLVGAEIAGGHGQGRGRHLHHIGDDAGRVLPRQRQRAARRARMQRVRGQAEDGPSGALRHLRHPAPAACRRQPAGDRLRARHAPGGGHLPDDQLRRQVAGRARVRARDGGAEPPQGRRLHPPRYRQLLPQSGARYSRSDHRVRHRHHAHHRQPGVLGHNCALSRHPLHLLACRGHHAVPGGAPAAAALDQPEAQAGLGLPRG